MSERERLPERRGNLSVPLWHENHEYRATGGYFADGRLAEIFLDVPGKAGTHLQSNASTAAILVSLLLQYGLSPGTIRSSVSGVIALALEELEGGR